MKKAMDRKLYEASIQGNVTSLLNLLHEDPLLIHKYITKPHHADTPLHIATLLGHVDFIKEILARKPDLAREINSERSTALHLASATGHVEIVQCLLSADAEMCTALDRNGMNPVHVAAVKGRVDALREIVRVRPDAARMVKDDGSTILHLCVKYNQLEAMKLLVGVDGVVDQEMVNSKDQEGNTALHLAVLDKQSQTVDFLLTSTSIDKDTHNAYGLTALDTAKLYSNGMSSRDEQSSMISIQESLRQHECGSPPRSISYSGPKTASPLSETLLSMLHKQQEERLKISIKKQKDQQAENRRNAIIIAATVITSMSFQVAANPPGGVWQDTSGSHIAGQAIMASVSPISYKLFIVLNTVAFSGSTFVFLLLLSRLQFLIENKYVIGAFNVALWMAILSSAICFTCAVVVTTPIVKMSVAFKAAKTVMYMAYVMWGVIFIGHVGSFLWKRVERRFMRSQNSTRPLDHGGVRA